MYRRYFNPNIPVIKTVLLPQSSIRAAYKCQYCNKMAEFMHYDKYHSVNMAAQGLNQIYNVFLCYQCNETRRLNSREWTSNKINFTQCYHMNCANPAEIAISIKSRKHVKLCRFHHMVAVSTQGKPLNYQFVDCFIRMDKIPEENTGIMFFYDDDNFIEDNVLVEDLILASENDINTTDKCILCGDPCDYDVKYESLIKTIPSGRICFDH